MQLLILLLAMAASPVFAQDCPTAEVLQAVVPKSAVADPNSKSCLAFFTGENKCAAVCASAKPAIDAAATTKANAPTSVDTTGSADAVSQAAKMGDVFMSGRDALNLVGAACTEQGTTCKTTCDAAIKSESTAAQSAPPGPQRQKLLQSVIDLGTLSKACDALMLKVGATATAGAGSYAAALSKTAGISDQIKNASTTKEDSSGFLSKNANWLIPAGTAVVGAGAGYMLGKSAGEDKQKQIDASASASAAAAASSSAATSITAGFSTASSDCTSAGTYTNSACASAYVSRCLTAPTGSQCQLFANSYCGLGDGTDAGGGVVPNGSGAGTSTAYCRATVGWRYCQTAGRSSCPSCVQQTTMTSPICTNNPSLCVGQYSQNQLSVMQTSCPADPYFTTYATAPTTSTTAVNVQTASSSFSTASALDGSLTASRDLASQQASTPGMQIVSGRLPTYEGAQSEVTAGIGKSLFTKSSAAIKLWCQSTLCQNVN